MDRQLGGSASQVMRGVAAVLAALVVTGCGGGGGNSGAATGPVAATPVTDLAQFSRTLLENEAGGVQALSADIDDQGRLLVVFSQDNGTRKVLKATLGQPGALGVAPVFSTPVVLDAQAPFNGSGEFRVAVSAAGHAVAVWTVTGPCAADTYNTTGLCNYAVSSRRMAGGDWEAPILVGDSPLAASGAVINDVGDVLVGLPSWTRDASGTVTVLTAAAWRPAASGRFTRQALPEISQSPGTLAVFGLDRLGEMTVVVSDASSGRNRIVAARGAVGTGFRSLETLDNGAGAVALEGMWAGVNGQLVVLWQQADGGVVRRWAAAAGASGQSLVSAERGLAPSIVGRGRFKAAVSDAGNFAAYDLENCQVMRLTGGNWQVNQPLPREFCTSSASQVTTVARNGNLIGALVDPAGTSGNTGQWLSYDAARNTMVQSLTTGASGSGYLFGVPSTVGGQLLLSESGLAAFVTINNFDTLPSASNAIGISGSVNNVWAILLKPI